MLLPGGLVGQQTPTGGSVLPDAPAPQMVDYSTSVQNSTQQTTPPAQQTTPPAPGGQQPQTQTPEQKRAEAERELQQEEHQRMLGVMPAFNEVIGGHAEPLTPGQKFHLFFKGSVDPFQFLVVGVDAGLEQAQDTYPEYRGGIGGFSKRYGAAFADDFDGNFWGNAVLPSLLHQDPRYFRLGHGTKLHRLLYSISTTVRTRSDHGKWQPNYSNLGGNFIGGAISNVYYPASDRGFALTIERGLTVSAEGTFGALAEEFYPDLAQHYRNRRARKAAAAAAQP
jgi:hypothetical protein